jgi:hypothetical protein
MRLKFYLLGFVCLFLSQTLSAQIINNGAFENWSEKTVDNPEGWATTNDELVRDGQAVATVFPIKKVTGQSGSAIQITTEKVQNDTLFGFFSSTSGDPIAGEGGDPYSQQPDSITGYYKYDIKSGDSAVMLVIFKKNGTVVNTDLFKIDGVQANFTRFAFPLTLSVVPDSVIIAAASSNAIDEVGMQIGSTITFDELAFSGASQAIPNGNFDKWKTDTLRNADSWNSFGGVARTSNAHKGNYALLLETKDFGGNVRTGILSSGIVNQSSFPTGGFPYTGTQDTLVFYYKYESVNGDTGLVILNFSKNGVPVGSPLGEALPATANYTKFEIPFQLGNAPDSMAVSFVSSNGSQQQPQDGSKLYVDEVHLKSEPLNTSIKDILVGNSIQLYPNPTTGSLTLNFKSKESLIGALQITDVLGRVVNAQTINITKGENTFTNTVSSLPNGIYFIQVRTNNTLIVTNKFIKE